MTYSPFHIVQITDFKNFSMNSLKVQETDKDGKSVLQSKFQNLNTKVYQNVDVR